jgi:hypothetical protein
MKRASDALCLCALAFVPACALIGNLDQFNGAVAAIATGPDANTGDAGGSTLPDASLDSATGTADGGNDASDAGESGALAQDGGEAGTRWCVANATPNTTFCRDFDDGKPYDYGFSSYLNMPDGGVPPTLVTSDAVSQPTSLLLQTPAVASSSSAQEQLVVHINDHPRIQLQFAVKLVNYQVGVGDLSLVRIAYDSGAWWCSWDLQSAANVYETIATPDGGYATAPHPTTMPPLGKWVNVVFTIDADAQTVSLSLDGITALQDAITAPPLVGSLSVTIGVNYLQGPAQPMSIYYDNVAIVTN